MIPTSRLSVPWRYFVSRNRSTRLKTISPQAAPQAKMMSCLAVSPRSIPFINFSGKATRWINGLPFDLIAISMEPAGWWLRRGEEEWLGELGDSPHHTKVLAWLRSGGKGSCWIGGCHGG